MCLASQDITYWASEDGALKVEFELKVPSHGDKVRDRLGTCIIHVCTSTIMLSFVLTYMYMYNVHVPVHVHKQLGANVS